MVTYFKSSIVSIPNSSVIGHNGESQNGGNKKTKHTKFSENEHFLPPDTHKGGKKSSFFGKFGVLYFLLTSVLRFTIMPYYRQIGSYT